MKYIIYYFFIILCIVIAIAISVPKPIKGDVNCDRRLTITDLVILHRHVVNDAEMKCPENGDMNGDFKLDMKDVNELRDILAGVK